jgi:hypothetical protein
MPEVDRLLNEAGARWRVGQPEPRAIDPAMFAQDRAPILRFARGRHPWSFLAGAASMAVLLAGLALIAPGLVPVPGGPPASPGSSADTRTGLSNCPLTQSDPTFAPPRQAGADWTGKDGHWRGSPALWTLIAPGGDIWRGLPRTEAGFTQKTFWWSEDFRVNVEPTPQIFVVGRRLDGPGAFGFGPGTNAGGSDIGSAMLVGIDVPTAGCWEMTASYRSAELTIVVWVGD